MNLFYVIWVSVIVMVGFEYDGKWYFILFSFACSFCSLPLPLFFFSPIFFVRFYCITSILYSNHFITISIYLLYFMQSVIFSILLSRIIILPHAYVRRVATVLLMSLSFGCFFELDAYRYTWSAHIYHIPEQLPYHRMLRTCIQINRSKHNRFALAIEHAQLNQHHWVATSTCVSREHPIVCLLFINFVREFVWAAQPSIL